MTKIIITGGHHNAALVVAEQLRAEGVEVSWIGHRYSSRGDTHDSAEYTEVTAANFPFHEVSAGRFTLSLRELLRIPFGLTRSLKLLRQLRPSAVLSFGGYVGAAVSLAAAVSAIPVYLHEQTRSGGLSNRLIGVVAKRVYLTWPESRRYFAAGKSRVVGLPLRQSILTATPKKFFNSTLPVLLVMGGKQGAHALNMFIGKHLPTLLADYNILHQTGTSSLTQDYKKALVLKENLGELGMGYLPIGYIGEADIGQYLRSADLYLGRSGAHIVYELAVLGLPCVLVPFSHARGGEQRQNAQYLQEVGLGVVVNESELTLETARQALKVTSHKKPSPQKLARDGGAILVKDLLKDVRGT